jgi:transcriptional regulator GlxA family with amidase domain
MSVSVLLQHFKAVTALSVGYTNASHFSREYENLFDAPPLHDVQRLRI